MSPTTLERPVERLPSPRPPGTARPRPPRRRAPDRWLLALGLALSALIHLVIFLVSPWFIDVGPPASESQRAQPRVEAPEGMRVYAITPVAEAAPPIEAQVEPPEPTPQPARPEPEPRPLPGEARGATDAPVRSPTERLRPELHDRRLWVMPDELPMPEKSDIERVRERVYGRLEELNDSLMMAEDAANRARDWTFTDEDGKRWGISPEGIHLGGITLPRQLVPQLGATNAETAERAREWREINAQADRARVRDRFNERVKAIRERKNQERAKKKNGSSGSGSSGSS